MTLLIEDVHDLDHVTRLAATPQPAMQIYVRLPWLDETERLGAARAMARHLSQGGWTGQWRLRRLAARLARGGVLAPRPRTADRHWC